MAIKTVIAAVGLMLGASMSITSASALPAARALDLPQGERPIEKAHSWHSTCQHGPAGWHYHSRRDGRVACVVRPRGSYWRWSFRDGRHGWWHWRDRRWH